MRSLERYDTSVSVHMDRTGKTGQDEFCRVARYDWTRMALRWSEVSLGWNATKQTVHRTTTMLRRKNMTFSSCQYGDLMQKIQVNRKTLPATI